MKKSISLILIMFFLCSLCLPIFAESGDATTVLEKTKKKVDKYYYEFENRCLYIPASINPAIFANINVEIEGEEVYLNSVASLEKIKDDEVIIIPEEEKNVAPICVALAQELPFLLIETKQNAETNESRIIVSLPEMTEDMKAVCEKLLNAYESNCSNKIDLLKIKTIPEIMGAGGTQGDIDDLEAMCMEVKDKVNTLKNKYAGCIKARHDLFIEKSRETASVFSNGGTAIIVGVGCFAVGFLVSMLIFKKRKQ